MSKSYEYVSLDEQMFLFEEEQVVEHLKKLDRDLKKEFLAKYDEEKRKIGELKNLEQLDKITLNIHKDILLIQEKYLC